MSVDQVPAGQGETTSVIHDIGYQRYAGARLGRGYVVRSLYTHGLRTAFGFGRSAKAKVFPWFVVGIVGLVALVLVATRDPIRGMMLSYADFPEQLSFLIILFCAVVAPELVSRDLRSGVLPLYFSRPLGRDDYALAKLAALITATWLMLGGAQLLMFVGGAFSLDGPRAIWDEFTEFLPGFAHSGLHAVVFSALAILVASLASRRAVAAALVVAVFLVTTPVVGVLFALGGETARQLASLASPMTMVAGVGAWLFRTEDDLVGDFGPVYAVATAGLVLVCVALLLIRYRSVAR
ncbi:MAG: ABC transporter permease subunit [Dactylosporangium sp.]|nr:ABC transporter permease subunit [Dactylosporangium sp.]